MSFPKAPTKRFNDKNKISNVSPKSSPRDTTSLKDYEIETVKPAVKKQSTNYNAKSAVSTRTVEKTSPGKASSTTPRPSSARRPTTNNVQTTGSASPKTLRLQPAPGSPRTPRQLPNMTKQKYTKMKKELKDKQDEMLNIYENMLKLRDEMINAGVKDIEVPEKPKIVDTGGGEDLTAAHKRVAKAIDNKSEYLSGLEEKLNSVSFWCFDYCQKAFTINNTVLSEISNIGFDKFKNSNTELHKTIEGLKKESLSLLQSLEKKKQCQEDAVHEVLQEFKALLQERKQLKENQTSDLEEEISQIQSEKDALVERLRSEFVKGKMKQAETESLLNKARDKIKEVEAKVSSQEGKIQQFSSQMRKFESQIKARERAHSNRLNDVAESTKILMEAKQTLEKQKTNLEHRVEDLKKLMTQKERKMEDTITKLNSNIIELSSELSAEKNEKEKLEEELETVTAQKFEMEDKLQELKDEVSKMTSGEYTQGPKSNENDEEMSIQLQATQVLLESTQRELAELKEEKAKIESSLKNMNILPENVESELMEKDNTLKSLNENIKVILMESEQKSRIISELKKKLNDLEKQVALKLYSNDRNRVHGSDTKYKIPETENELMKLREDNSDMEKQLRDLHEELQQKELEQAKAIKDRDEMIRVLKEKSRMQAEKLMDLLAIVHEHESAATTVCNATSGKDAEISDLQKILELKQLQVKRLENIVKKQEEQLDRWGLQRTKHEARIAELENSLREKQRYCDYQLWPDDSSDSCQENSETNFPEEQHPVDYISFQKNPLNSCTGVDSRNNTQIVNRDLMCEETSVKTLQTTPYIQAELHTLHGTRYLVPVKMPENAINVTSYQPLEANNIKLTQQIPFTDNPKTLHKSIQTHLSTKPLAESLFSCSTNFETYNTNKNYHTSQNLVYYCLVNPAENKNCIQVMNNEMLHKVTKESKCENGSYMHYMLIDRVTNSVSTQIPEDVLDVVDYEVLDIHDNQYENEINFTKKFENHQIQINSEPLLNRSSFLESRDNAVKSHAYEKLICYCLPNYNDDKIDTELNNELLHGVPYERKPVTGSDIHSKLSNRVKNSVSTNIPESSVRGEACKLLDTSNSKCANENSDVKIPKNKFENQQKYKISEPFLSRGTYTENSDVAVKCDALQNSVTNFSGDCAEIISDIKPIDNDVCHEVISEENVVTASYIQTELSDGLNVTKPKSVTMTKTMKFTCGQCSNSVNSANTGPFTSRSVTPTKSHKLYMNDEPLVEPIFNTGSHLENCNRVIKCQISKTCNSHCLDNQGKIFLSDQSTATYKNDNITSHHKEIPIDDEQFDLMDSTEEFTTIYRNEERAWHYQDNISEEGQVYNMYDSNSYAESPESPVFTNSEFSEYVSESYSPPPLKHMYESHRKFASKSDPTPLNKSYDVGNYNITHTVKSDNIIHAMCPKCKSKNKNICKTCGGRVPSYNHNVKYNYSDFCTEVPIMYGDQSSLDEREQTFCNQSTDSYLDRHERKCRLSPVTEFYEESETTIYSPDCYGDHRQSRRRKRQKNYLRSKPEVYQQQKQYKENLCGLINSSIIMCSSPSAVLLLNCPYITNYLVQTHQFVKHGCVPNTNSILANERNY